MADVNIKLKRSERSKKIIKKNGGNVYIERELKGWAKRQEIMKQNVQPIEYNNRFAKCI